MTAGDVATVEPVRFPEIEAEQTPDGTFRRQRNLFSARFGDGAGEFPVVAGRYHLLGSLDCGWFRRQLIVRRLLGLEGAIPVEFLLDRDLQGWKIARQPGGADDRYGFRRLNDFYRAVDPDFVGRGTSPAIVDYETGAIVTNNYHLISIDLETAWRPLHREGAPDLYPEALRQEIDLLNQQLFDDVNNGTYKVIFAANGGAAAAAYRVFAARLADYDFRLTSRRYLFGDRLTDSDVRLYQTLSSFEFLYRPGIVRAVGADVLHIADYPNLWAYARDLFAQGFSDEADQYHLGLIPGKSGKYIPTPFESPQSPFHGPRDYDNAAQLAAWLEPHGREALEGSPAYSGPGAGGSFELWQFGR